MNGTELQVDVHGMNYAAGVYGGPDFYGEFLNKEGHEHLSGYSSESSSTMSSRGEYFPRKHHVSSYDLTEPDGEDCPTGSLRLWTNILPSVVNLFGRALIIWANRLHLIAMPVFCSTILPR